MFKKTATVFAFPQFFIRNFLWGMRNGPMLM